MQRSRTWFAIASLALTLASTNAKADTETQSVRCFDNCFTDSNMLEEIEVIASRNSSFATALQGPFVVISVVASMDSNGVVSGGIGTKAGIWVFSGSDEEWHYMASNGAITQFGKQAVNEKQGSCGKDCK